LTALRLVGFKSFAERTEIEFGPGISAVVGPNGSGKSNLADALRWTLGEQGRSLRTRRSEDVIFAGSSARRAIGMADVTLVIDNGDRLLPVDYGEVEIGRRLYRSGENEYLLNRQRVRLRDLVDLLDAGNLADNAFLFIGQGMVDQALALRPEERRPLFEEVAGVRRHERRRRHAEAELAEAEANIERLRDVLGELRPQARRLAAQAEQLNARRTAGLELAEALVAAAHRRWSASSHTAATEQLKLEQAHARADAEMAALRAAEELAEQHSRALGERAEVERRKRSELEAQRAQTMELRLSEARRLSEIEALERDRRRSADERSALETRMGEAHRVLAAAPPAPDGSSQAELRRTEQELADLGRTLDSAAQDAPESGSSAQLRRDARASELEQLRTRQQALAEHLAGTRRRAAALTAASAGAEAARSQAVEQLEHALTAEADLEGRNQQTRGALDQAIARHAEAARATGEGQARLAASRGRLASLEATIAAGENAALVRAARARGGTRLAEGLEVEPELRLSVSAALADALRAVAVPEAAVSALRQSTGVLLIGDLPRPRASAASQASAEAMTAAAIAAGGDLLAAAIRRDPLGHVTRLLARTLWVPELEDALALRAVLTAGWRVVTRRGEVVTDEGLVRLAAGDTELQLRAQHEELAGQLEREEKSLSVASAELRRLADEQALATANSETLRRELDEARRKRRVAEEAERGAQRRAESLLREADWERAQLERGEKELEAISDTIAEAQAEVDTLSRSRAPATDRPATDRLEAVRARHQRLAAAVAVEERERRSFEEGRRRAEISLGLDESRSNHLDAEFERLASREAQLGAERERVTADLATATERERRVGAELDALLRDEAHDRQQLIEAERSATEARERLRRAEAASRSAEVAAMEARLHLEQVHEQLLVELAGIGADGLLALRRTSAHPTEPPAAMSPDALGSQLEEAMESAVQRWTTEPAPDEGSPPGTGRLAALRRRFHELGAGNPFATEEYAEVRQRLETMEAQQADLQKAMAGTRELIANLSKLITEQFLSTFAALEGAFARRFEQLFDGGEAQLSLTTPEDLSATGVEITARPPGKKRQPLAMLSGGERALTAVALLLAMLEVRPVPFCVLDEVDAALDEANIARFSAAVRGLADRTQFIVITHNRGTIEAADALYGVTIGEDAVSRIVSLRLPAAGSNGKATDGLAANEALAAEPLSG
jgi:chromosome segregation protein